MADKKTEQPEEKAKIVRNRKTWEELTAILDEDIPTGAEKRSEFIMDIVRLDDILKVRQKSAADVFKRVDEARKDCGAKLEACLKTKSK